MTLCQSHHATSRFKFSASLVLTQDPMMAYMLLQRWRAPVSVELHPYGKVAVAGGELQGWWASEGAAKSLSVCFDDDPQAQSQLFEGVQGGVVPHVAKVGGSAVQGEAQGGTQAE